MEVKLAAERHNIAKTNDEAKRYNKGKLRWRNIPHFMLKGLVEVGQYGEEKYGESWNFLKGQSVSAVMESLIRHVEKLESPFEADIDAESGKNHAYHIAWNALYIAYILEHKPQFDDRYKPENSIEAPDIFVSEEDLNALGLRKFKGE